MIKVGMVQSGSDVKLAFALEIGLIPIATSDVPTLAGMRRQGI